MKNDTTRMLLLWVISSEKDNFILSTKNMSAVQLTLVLATELQDVIDFYIEKELNIKKIFYFFLKTGSSAKGVYLL